MKYLFSLLLIAASITVFVVLIRPKYQALQIAKQAVIASSGSLDTAATLAKSREALIATYNSIPKADLDNLKTLLPDSVNNIRLIIQINSLATKNGLSLLRNVDYQAAIQDPTTQDNPDIVKRPYGEFSISFQTSGQYKNFLAFLSDLEQNLRLVDVTKVEFSATDQTQALAGSTTFKVTLKTYWLKQ